jgi:hypothetical protein
VDNDSEGHCLKDCASTRPETALVGDGGDGKPDAVSLFVDDVEDHVPVIVARPNHARERSVLCGSRRGKRRNIGLRTRQRSYAQKRTICRWCYWKIQLKRAAPAVLVLSAFAYIWFQMPSGNTYALEGTNKLNTSYGHNRY